MIPFGTYMRLSETALDSSFSTPDSHHVESPSLL